MRIIEPDQDGAFGNPLAGLETNLPHFTGNRRVNIGGFERIAGANRAYYHPVRREAQRLHQDPRGGRALEATLA